MKFRRTSNEVTGAVEYRYRELRIVWSKHAVYRIRQRLNSEDMELAIPHRRMYKAAKRSAKINQSQYRTRFQVQMGCIRLGCLLIGDTILIRTVIKRHE